MLSGLNDLDIPVISAINGPATVHSEIPVMADFVLAAEHVVFADRSHFATRDTVPAMWSTDHLGRTTRPDAFEVLPADGKHLDAPRGAPARGRERGPSARRAP